MRLFITFSFSFLFTLGIFAQEVVLNDGLYMKEGRPYSGIFQEFDETGELKTVYSINKGLLDGETTIYKQEQLIERRNYKKGKKHGLWEKYENTILVSRAAFHNDRKHGKWLIWDVGGVLRYEMFYKKGKKKGTWRIWDENGVLQSTRDY